MFALKNISVKLKEFAVLMKKKIKVLYIASKRKDINLLPKIVLIIVVGYALSPIDLIPDFIPVLGYLDDVILLPLGISFAFKLMPKNIIKECEKIAVEEEKLVIYKNKLSAAVIVFIWIVLFLFLGNITLKKLIITY